MHGRGQIVAVGPARGTSKDVPLDAATWLITLNDGEGGEPRRLLRLGRFLPNGAQQLKWNSHRL
jgi:hypothetical protein